ncbi:hypothetical protein ACFVH7_18030 [Kitasatospora indigofera]|uniref:hypothetical protein n=1 Tax=Kitasatospora indigofera TaxID=67307 RepID=UPI0036342E90
MSGVDEVLERAGADEVEVLAREWLRGLACNPALPGAVLRRLLEFEELPAHPLWLTWRELDAEATAAAVSSPRMRYRLDVVQNPTADADALVPLAHDVEPRVRFAYAALLTDFGRRVPAGVPEVLAGDAHPGVRRLVTGCLTPELDSYDVAAILARRASSVGSHLAVCPTSWRGLACGSFSRMGGTSWTRLPNGGSEVWNWPRADVSWPHKVV